MCPQENGDPLNFEVQLDVDGERVWNFEVPTDMPLPDGWVWRSGSVENSDGETVVLGDRMAYREIWFSLVKEDEPDEIIVVWHMYAPQVNTEYGVKINDKHMPEQVPGTPPPARRSGKG